jgi:hypothetical protein
MGVAFSIADAEIAQKKTANTSFVMRVIMEFLQEIAYLDSRISRQRSCDINILG